MYSELSEFSSIPHQIQISILISSQVYQPTSPIQQHTDTFHPLPPPKTNNPPYPTLPHPHHNWFLRPPSLHEQATQSTSEYYSIRNGKYPPLSTKPATSSRQKGMVSLTLEYQGARSIIFIYYQLLIKNISKYKRWGYLKAKYDHKRFRGKSNFPILDPPADLPSFLPPPLGMAKLTLLPPGHVLGRSPIPYLPSRPLPLHRHIMHSELGRRRCLNRDSVNICHILFCPNKSPPFTPSHPAHPPPSQRKFIN